MGPLCLLPQVARWERAGRLAGEYLKLDDPVVNPAPFNRVNGPLGHWVEGYSPVGPFSPFYSPYSRILP
jgi:hypothetical protein